MERQPWFYTGTDTMYDAIFRKQLEFIHKSGGTKPDTKMYSKVAGCSGRSTRQRQRFREGGKQIIRSRDIGEGLLRNHKAHAGGLRDSGPHQVAAVRDNRRALPSNVGGGYNLRIILRRIFDFVEEHNIGIDLMKVMEMHAKDLKPYMAT